MQCVLLAFAVKEPNCLQIGLFKRRRCLSVCLTDLSRIRSRRQFRGRKTRS